MTPPLDIQVPLDAAFGPAFVSGVIETLYASHAASWGLGKPEVFHRFEIGSDLEAAFAKGCEFACVRMLSEGNMAAEEDTNN